MLRPVSSRPFLHFQSTHELPTDAAAHESPCWSTQARGMSMPPSQPRRIFWDPVPVSLVLLLVLVSEVEVEIGIEIGIGSLYVVVVVGGMEMEMEEMVREVVVGWGEEAKAVLLPMAR